MWRLCPDSCQRKVAAQLFFSREVDRGEQWGSERIAYPFRATAPPLHHITVEAQLRRAGGMDGRDEEGIAVTVDTHNVTMHLE